VINNLNIDNEIIAENTDKYIKTDLNKIIKALNIASSKIKITDQSDRIFLGLNKTPINLEALCKDVPFIYTNIMVSDVIEDKDYTNHLIDAYEIYYPENNIVYEKK